MDLLKPVMLNPTIDFQLGRRGLDTEFYPQPVAFRVAY